MGEVFSVDDQASACQVVHPADDVDEGGLAAAGFTENHDKFVLIDVEVDPFQDTKHAFTGGKLLDDAAQRDEDLLLLAGGDGKAFFLNGERRQRRDPFAELLLFFVKARAVLLVDHLDASHHFGEVLQGDAQHASHQGTAVVEHAARIFSGDGVLDQNSLPVAGDEPLHAETVFRADICEVDRTGVKRRHQAVRVLIQKPHRAGFAVENAREHLQSAGKSL